VFARVQVEHELDQRALQLRECALQHHEAGAGNLGGHLEIHEAEAFAEVYVILRCEIQLPWLAPTTHFLIVTLILAVRDARVRDIGNAKCDGIEIVLQLFEFSLGLFECSTDAGHLVHQWLRVLATRLGLADGLGFGVAFVLVLLRGHLDLLALFFQAGDGRHVQRKAAAREQPGGIVEIGAEQFWIEHGRCVVKYYFFAADEHRWSYLCSSAADVF
jgi:hypothetical protein